MQTKLTADQKEILADMKIDAATMGIKVVNDGNTTIAYMVQGNTVRFSTSVTAPTEKKFRRKVGEYLALNRLIEDNEYVIMNKFDFDNMMTLVYYIVI